jgi:hypothetical protein
VNVKTVARVVRAKNAANVKNAANAKNAANVKNAAHVKNAVSARIAAIARIVAIANKVGMMEVHEIVVVDVAVVMVAKKAHKAMIATVLTRTNQSAMIPWKLLVISTFAMKGTASYE